MLLTLMLGALFLAFQLGSWGEIARQLQGAPAHFFTAMFYVISAIARAAPAGRAGVRRDSALPSAGCGRVNVQSVELGAIYWHFLGILWAALFGVMLIK
jgi:heme/copper-type cytochrome/quinol oxidase subunit 3